MSATRRALLAAATTPLAACAFSRASALTRDKDDGDETIELWPAGPPGGAGVTVKERIEERTHPEGLRDRLAHDVTRPILSVFRPERPDGSALLIIPGGAYWLVAVDVEGMESGRRWASRGTTAFVLRYRLPGDGWAAGPDTSLQDAQRALRVIRARAAGYGYEANRIGVVGFSAGGHLAGSLATRFDAPVYKPVDDADTLSARPDMAALVYPVVTMRTAAHDFSRLQLLGETPTEAQIAAYSLETAPPASTPPTILIHAADDDGVKPENSLLLFAALRKAKVAAELHIFEEGGHGFGLRGVAGKPVAAWPELVDRFGARHKVFSL